MTDLREEARVLSIDPATAFYEALSKWSALQHEGISVIVLSREAVKCNVTQLILKKIHKRGFTLLFDRPLEDNWVYIHGEPAMFGGAGGVASCTIEYPGHIIVALDLLPQLSSSQGLEQLALISNERTHELGKIRHDVVKEAGIDIGGLYWSRNSLAAMHLLYLTFPNLLPRIASEAQEVMERFLETPYEVVRDLTGHGRRSKVEVVRRRGRLAVKKTFKPGFESHLEKERYAYGTLSKRIAALPPLLEDGINYIVIPYYEDLLARGARNGWLPLVVARRAIETARQLSRMGYLLLDFKPSMVLLEGTGAVKLIDLEFLCQLPRDAAIQFFETSYTTGKAPTSFPAEVPLGGFEHCLHAWRKATGVEMTHLLSSPLWIQYGLRTINLSRQRTRASLSRLVRLIR